MVEATPPQAKATPTIDGTVGADRPTPEFFSCLIDANAPLLTVNIGNDRFKLRSITALEYQSAFARSLKANPKPTGPGGAFTISDRYDTNGLAFYTVAAALGATKKIGNEGWTFNLPISEATVGQLEFGVLVHLYQEHQKFFRAERFGIPESQPGAGVEPPPANG